MGYVFLMLALLSGVTKGYCGKKTSGSVTAYTDAMLVNALRMVLCIAFGFGLLVLQGDAAKLAVDGTTLAITALSGVTTSVFVVTWLLSVRKGAYMMVDVFLMLGVMVTILLSALCFGEAVTGKQVAGLVVLLAAVGVMCSYNNGVKEKLTPGALLLVMASGLANGLTDFSQKLFVHHVQNSTAAVFNFYTYVFSALTLIGLFAFSHLRERQSGAARPSEVRQVLGKTGGYVLVMALCLYANSFFKTQAAALLPAAQLYPLNQGCGLMLSSLMAAVFFKEKLTPKAIAGLVMAFVALLVINVL